MVQPPSSLTPGLAALARPRNQRTTGFHKYATRHQHQTLVEGGAGSAVHGHLRRVGVRKRSVPQTPHTHRLTQEDLALRAIVKQWQLNGDNEGRAKWPAIADELNARTGIERAPKQCRERYKNVVADGVVVGQWTESDDAVILQRHTEVGNKWVKIAQFLAGRPENSVKNRYHSLLRRALKGDQYPIQVAKQAGGTAFLAAVELKLAGGAGGAGAGGAKGSRAAGRGTKRRRAGASTSAAAGAAAAKMPSLGVGGRGSLPGMMPGMSGGMFTTGMPSHAHSMFMPLHGMQGDAGGNMLVSGGPHTFNDIATATVAAMQAAAAMQESLVSMNTETQIAMIAAAMTGSPDVDPAVQDQLRRSEDLWKGLLSSTASMGGMKGYHGSLPGYPMLAVPPTSAAGPVPVSAAAIPAPAGVSAGMAGPVHLAVSMGESAQAASVPGVTVASQAPAGLSSAPPVVSAPATAPTSGAQQHLVRDLMGRDLTISIPNMASGGPGLPGSMGFQLPGGPLSSAGSPMFMFSPSNGPFGVMGLGGGGPTSTRSDGMGMGGDSLAAAGTPTAFLVGLQGGGEGDAAAPAPSAQ